MLPLRKPFPERWWYGAPWTWSHPWKPSLKVYRNGGDEYCNPTVQLILPLLGGVTVRYKPGPIRTEACAKCQDEFGPWCPACVACHWSPACHPGVRQCLDYTGHLEPFHDCPECGGQYCTECEDDPLDYCPKVKL